MDLRILLLVAEIIAIISAFPTSSGDDYVSKPLSIRNYERILAEHENVFVKFFTSWYVEDDIKLSNNKTNEYF